MRAPRAAVSCCRSSRGVCSFARTRRGHSRRAQPDPAPPRRVFGYKNICMPYLSFVCGMCKAAHQAYSHRVKVRRALARAAAAPPSHVRPLTRRAQEINQSNFSTAEVDSLRPRNGGGNDRVRRTWLARCGADAPERPRDADPLDKFKAFVLMAYEQRRW